LRFGIFSLMKTALGPLVRSTAPASATAGHSRRDPLECTQPRLGSPRSAFGGPGVIHQGPIARPTRQARPERNWLGTQGATRPRPRNN
jgi:hypothetical protein